MLDRASLENSTKVALKAAPIEPTWIVAGNPIARNGVLAQSADRSTTTILWECSEGAFNWRYTFDETIYFLRGAVTIQRPGEKARTYGPGDFIHFSVGDCAQWIVHDPIRKVAFCRNPPPMPVAMALRASRGLARRFRAMTGAPSAPSLAEA